ncbi:MAG TPA: RNA polymerase sigma factor [Blastocatellia bacterium]|nr:RNA polymerase sigma factor [Blastocatellia bacterium]
MISRIQEKEMRFNAVVQEYGRFLRSVIIRLCPKDLGLEFGDIEQEARLKLWRALQSESEIGNLQSYIYRIAATATIDAIRKAKARREGQLRLADEEEELEGEPQFLAADEKSLPDRIAERRQLMQKIEQALERLPDNRRRAVGLYLEGMTSREIADIMGWSEPKARNLTYRGLEDLRQQLRAEGVEYEID